MTLIKIYFLGSLPVLMQNVPRRTFEQVTNFGRTFRSSLPFPCLHLAHEDVFDTARINILYTRFIMVAERLAALLGEIGRRAAVHQGVGSSAFQVLFRAMARTRALVTRLHLSISTNPPRAPAGCYEQIQPAILSSRLPTSRHIYELNL